MNREIKIIGLAIILVITGITNSFSQSKKFIPKHSTIITSNKGPEMLRQCSRAVPGNVETYFDLNQNEIEELENNFKKVLDIKSTDCCFSGIKIRGLKNYVFQYVGLIIKGEKYIYINAFQIESQDDLTRFYKEWKTSPVIICDGGDSVWGVLFKLKDKKFSHLSINGVA
ncbi:hypothetical protein [uncultured Draconibacterium sp.]|uniref:hypothetical protein n=1 Tax=uncultured Draconibacterium sp. TaxID=1573823 RepID=UPI002AA8FE92|nr:hypothetical protein [uncultured Draconibacterium sp.]